MSTTTDRWQAQHDFWSSFGIPAYEENTVPHGVTYPYITYQAASSRFSGTALISASVWTRSTGWTQADTLSDTIEARLKNGGETLPYDGGMIWIVAGTPFSQSMGDLEDGEVRRKLLNVEIHYC